MNPLKTPREKLMEETGLVPATPGMLKTPRQLVMEESGVMPRLQEGGQVQMSPQDMLAMLLAYNQTPQQFAGGKEVQKEEEMSPEFARALLAAYDKMPPIPEPTAQAQPTTATTWTRDKLAQLIGELPADRLFGTGSEGQKSEYLPLQILNPALAATTAIDAVPQIKQQLQDKNYGTAAATAGGATLGALPFVGPAKKGLAHILKKIKQ